MYRYQSPVISTYYDDDHDTLHGAPTHDSTLHFDSDAAAELDIERIPLRSDATGSISRHPQKMLHVTTASNNRKPFMPVLDGANPSLVNGVISTSGSNRSGRQGATIGDGHVDLSPFINSDNFFNSNSDSDHFMLDGTMITSHNGPNNDNSLIQKSLLSSILPPRAPPSSKLLIGGGTHSAGNGIIQQGTHTAPKAMAIFSDGPIVKSSMIKTFRLNQYHPLNEIYAYLDQLASRYDRVRVFNIGTTSEGRPLKAIEIINNSTDPDYVWLDALTHAREWITGSTILYIIDQIASGKSTRNKNFLIVPVVNPDGYSYTW